MIRRGLPVLVHQDHGPLDLLLEDEFLGHRPVDRVVRAAQVIPTEGEFVDIALVEGIATLVRIEFDDVEADTARFVADRVDRVVGDRGQELGSTRRFDTQWTQMQNKSVPCSS